MLVLQVVEQARPLGCQVFADDCHPEVAAVLAAVLFGQREAPEAGGVGATYAFGEEGFPVWVRKATVGPVGTGVFAPVVEEAVVVVRVLEGGYGGVDKGVKRVEVLDKVRGKVEIHFERGRSNCACCLVVSDMVEGGRVVGIRREPSAQSFDRVSVFFPGLHDS